MHVDRGNESSGYLYGKCRFHFQGTDEHDFLGGNLVEISSLVLGLETNDLKDVFGTVDYMKLRSCMTLFAEADSDYEVFFRVLEKYYDGEPCEKTLKILNNV